MSAYDDLLAERYGRDTHTWWQTPEKVRVDVFERKKVALQVRLEAIGLDVWATQETDELEKARERAGRGAA